MIEKAINQIFGTFIVISFLIAVGVAGGYEKDLIGFLEGIFILGFDCFLFGISYIVLRMNNV